MKIPLLLKSLLTFGASMLLAWPAQGQVGRQFPSEKKVVSDPVTGTPLIFLTSQPLGDGKIYQTHPDWTSDGQWVIFRSNRGGGQVFAVNETTGVIVQVTDRGYMNMLCVARRAMKLYLTRDLSAPSEPTPGQFRSRGPWQIIEVDLAKLFTDSLAGQVQPGTYERVCGLTPAGLTATGNMGLDANEDFAYFGVTGDQLASLLPAGTKPAPAFGPHHLGAGPTGLASMNLKTGEVKIIVAVPFQIGHIQTNPWVPGEIVFCWETGGKSPQRTWTIRSDGTGLRPLYPEASYEWVTHEAVITRDEVAMNLEGERKPGVPKSDPWGGAGTDDHPSGFAVVNLRTREMRIIGQVPMGNPGKAFWHVNGSADGRWAAADDHLFRLWIIDRHTGEQIMLADLGHRIHAADHVHPTFSADGTRIDIQCALLSPDERSLNICIVPMPRTWLARTYSDIAPP